MKKLLLAAIALVFLSCNRQTPKTAASNDAVTDTLSGVSDPHSFAEPARAIVKHLDLDLNVDFASKIITGKAVWTIANLAKTDEIVFDTRDLAISKVTVGADEKETMFALGDDVKYLGKPLSVNIDAATTMVSIYYTTSTGAAALQWLDPAQTAGKKFPFLFTQSEAILARTWIPCQDSPGIRFTYNASVHVPKAFLALMSAENTPQKSADGRYTFKQPHAIPSYLMALTVGDLGFKAIDERTGVYAEPVTLQKAAWELADVGKMVNAAEKIYGPYRWGRYDFLVLPPSFPFGGMENPMLTFGTPTILAGDRSLVSLVAHELAHSWSGNLVTNATWNDFWLNEGFTTYFERRIVEAVYSRDQKEMQEVLGFQDLKDEMVSYGPKNPDTRLKTDFKDRDPDEGVSSIAYEKGYAFLKVIEHAVGRDKFDGFLRKYFDSHAFQSMTTEKFLAYLDENLVKGDENLKKVIAADAWVYQPGIPSNAVIPVSAKFNAIDKILASWTSAKNSIGLKQKITSANEILYFLRHLPATVTAADMAGLDREFNFTNSGNSEIQCVWYTLAAAHHYEAAYPKTAQYLTEVGRRKLVMPIYKELVKTPEGKQRAQAIYTKARPNYHSVTYGSVDALLK